MHMYFILWVSLCAQDCVHTHIHICTHTHVHICQPALKSHMASLAQPCHADYPRGDPCTPAAPALYSGADTSGPPSPKQVVDKMLWLDHHEAGDVLPTSWRDLPLPRPVTRGVPRNWSR